MPHCVHDHIKWVVQPCCVLPRWMGWQATPCMYPSCMGGPAPSCLCPGSISIFVCTNSNTQNGKGVNPCCM